MVYHHGILVWSESLSGHGKIAILVILQSLINWACWGLHWLHSMSVFLHVSSKEDVNFSHITMASKLMLTALVFYHVTQKKDTIRRMVYCWWGLSSCQFVNKSSCEQALKGTWCWVQRWVCCCIAPTSDTACTCYYKLALCLCITVFLLPLPITLHSRVVFVL